jgi:hypothetical protein
MQIAILDDYQNIALKMADWTAISKKAVIAVFNDHLADQALVVEKLLPFTVICIMRERKQLSYQRYGRMQSDPTEEAGEAAWQAAF